MKRTLEEIEADYKHGETTWGFSKVFQAVSDIAGLCMMVRSLKDELEHLRNLKITETITLKEPLVFDMKEICKKHAPVKFFGCGQCYDDLFKEYQELINKKES